MPGENLTRREALTRSSHITVKSYDIDIDIRDAAISPTFRTHTTIKFVAAPLGDTFLDAITAQVHSVRLNGVDLDVDEVCADSRIALNGLQADNLVDIVADFSYMNTGEGLHRFVDPVDDEVYLYSQFEVPDSTASFCLSSSNPI